MDKSKKGQKEIKPKIIEGLKKLIKYTVIFAVILITLFYFFPENISNGVGIARNYGYEMITIFPAVLILMGLADVWIPKSLINKYLGKESGIKGIIISISLGTLPTGPLYVAFPIAHELIKKKAKISNVMIFLGVWAAAKIPQIGVEIKFLGFKFAFLRFIFTITSLIIIGQLIEYIYNKKEIDNTI